jgi:2-haloacid dehalogenase
VPGSFHVAGDEPYHRPMDDRTTTGPLDFERFDALTFDCYGTLIDWEAGLATALRVLLGSTAVGIDEDALLETYAGFESAGERPPYRTYREVLATAGRDVADTYGLAVSEDAIARFGRSVVDWPAFADSAAALARLKTRFRLGVLTNCDDDLFAASNAKLGIEFDWVVTAQQVSSYKPAMAHFETFFERSGLSRERVLHVAQSLYHDHVPANILGMTSVWIDRRHGRYSPGATPAAVARPTAAYTDMASFAAAAVPDA